MIKKCFLFVLLLGMTVAVAHSSTWKIYPCYDAKQIQNVFDTGDKVYYLNCYRLYQFDKTTCQTVELTKQNILTDYRIRQIYYDWENRLLFVAYYSSAIDVIDAEGKVTNISAIKDITSVVHNYTFNTSEDNYGALQDYTSKLINDITFAGGKAYVTIGYGYVVIEESTMRVIKSYDLGMSITINSVAVVGNTMIILSNNQCYYGEPEVNDPIHTYAKKSGTFNGAKMYPIDDHQVFIMLSSLYKYDFSSGAPVSTNLISSAKATNIQKTPTGFFANFEGNSYCYTINAEATTATKTFSTACFATSDPLGDGTVWINDANGLHVNGTSVNYKLNLMTTDAPFWLKFNSFLNKLYVSNSAPNKMSPATASTVNVINTFDGSEWADATAYSASGSGYEFVFNPLDPTMYFRASWNKGLHKVVNDVLKSTYYYNYTAPIGYYKPHPAFDNYGNLWVVSSYTDETHPLDCPVAVLPKDKVTKTTSSKSDWFQPSGLLVLNTHNMQRSSFVISKKNNYKIYNDGDFPTAGKTMGQFLCWDNGSEDVTDDNYRIRGISQFSDQYGRRVDWNYVNHMEEDKDGMIWVGHTMGLFMFDPDVVFDAVPRAIRPIVASSSVKEILCEGYSVFDIGVDRHNDKWLATNDGVYYVSHDGCKVHAHFTTSNSDLPSDLVYSVECDTLNDRVFIVTDVAFAEYIPIGSSSSLNFDNVYVFPNPVEPDFTGMVKISNLMDNTYVSIANRNGVIVRQLGPVTGGALWDACNENGQRVPTGVYNIYCAHGAQPTISGTPHATIMVIW